MSTYNHTGQVVIDLERSKRFYQEVHGFVLEPARCQAALPRQP